MTCKSIIFQNIYYKFIPFCKKNDREILNYDHLIDTNHTL
jgi:hypothetical protein